MSRRLTTLGLDPAYVTWPSLRYCGPASERNAMALLRYNTKMIHGAFAVEPSGAGEMITVRANQLADTVDQLEVTKTLTAIAWQADKVEEKLLGSDNH